MAYFTPMQLEKLAQDAAYEGRESELRVLLGAKPLIRKDTYQLEHKKNGLEHDLILLKGTKNVVGNIILALQEEPELKNFRDTALSIAKNNLKKIALGNPVALPASASSTQSAASPTRSQALMVLNESRALISHPFLSSERKLDWTVNPYAIHHIHKQYVESRIREQERFIEIILADKKSSREKVIEKLKSFVEDLTERIEAKEAELGELKKQIEEKTKAAKNTYHEHANGWFEQVKQIIRERLPHTLTEVSIDKEEQTELAEEELDKHVSPKIRRKIISELKAEKKSRPISIPGAHTEPEEKPSLLETLKNANVDINCVNSKGNRIIDLAILPSAKVEKSVKLAIVDYLTQGGAELEYPDGNGITPTRKVLMTSMESNDRSLFKVIADRKIQDKKYPLYPDIAWYLECKQALKDEGPRRVKAHAEKYIHDRKELGFWREVYARLFENKEIREHRLTEAEWLSDRSDEVLLDGDHNSFTQDVRAYKDNNVEFGLRNEEGSELWKETLEAISDMEQKKYGDREMEITFLDSLEHRSLKATVLKLEKEREEDRKEREADRAKINAQESEITQLKEGRKQDKEEFDTKFAEQEKSMKAEMKIEMEAIEKKIAAFAAQSYQSMTSSHASFSLKGQMEEANPAVSSEEKGEENTARPAFPTKPESKQTNTMLNFND